MTSRLTSFTSGNLTFDVRDEGPLDGPVVVALHGFPQTSACWSGVIPPLVAAGHRVLAPDQRGYSPGARPSDVASYATARLAGDVLALADAAGADRFHLVGHDWGAAVGWTLAGRHADRVASFTAVSVPHPAALARALRGTQALRSWYMAAFQVPGLAERVFRARGGDVVRRLLTRSGLPDPEPSVRLLADPAAATGTVNWYRALRLPGNLRAGRTRVPTLYVWSDRDVALGRRAAEGTAAFVDGPYRFVVLAGVSHWVPEERPAELAALLLEHLAAHPSDR
ncbi:Pimeloyl-ACP methyl ester carboxylesterase [Friedmanniella luteola]|uniref:Pimeloyl-ACP methyl ester carboxylesterase n=1 Tax=Friedmanniella luteola TaxID=546871 RepID=A0A1H1LQZ0_9ACTN|nr:alpha/beta fold hydrolase [Friedmanniella luteola]SDR76435.1 Pimeloyl-ACP methyl ester carboxylesterase [Friedmanniella luteola]